MTIPRQAPVNAVTMAWPLRSISSLDQYKTSMPAGRKTANISHIIERSCA
jgi:hypothetical protein